MNNIIQKVIVSVLKSHNGKRRHKIKYDPENKASYDEVFIYGIVSLNPCFAGNKLDSDS